jgi:hypothetical protein
VGGLTGLLARLRGYDIEAGPLDPRETAGAPVAHERHFWVLTRAPPADAPDRTPQREAARRRWSGERRVSRGSR